LAIFFASRFLPGALLHQAMRLSIFLPSYLLSAAAEKRKRLAAAAGGDQAGG
jgi:hypothetical protein